MDAPANDAAEYFDRFPAAHRTTAERAYRDGHHDGYEEGSLDAASVIEAAEMMLALPAGQRWRDAASGEAWAALERTIAAIKEGGA